jgi:hypothetical protein
VERELALAESPSSERVTLRPGRRGIVVEGGVKSGRRPTECSLDAAVVKATPCIIELAPAPSGAYVIELSPDDGLVGQHERVPRSRPTVPSLMS